MASKVNLLGAIDALAKANENEAARDRLTINGLEVDGTITYTNGETLEMSEKLSVTTRRAIGAFLTSELYKKACYENSKVAAKYLGKGNAEDVIEIRYGGDVELTVTRGEVIKRIEAVAAILNTVAAFKSGNWATAHNLHRFVKREKKSSRVVDTAI